MIGTRPRRPTPASAAFGGFRVGGGGARLRPRQPTHTPVEARRPRSGRPEGQMSVVLPETHLFGLPDDRGITSGLADIHPIGCESARRDRSGASAVDGGLRSPGVRPFGARESLVTSMLTCSGLGFRRFRHKLERPSSSWSSGRQVVGGVSGDIGHGKSLGRDFSTSCDLDNSASLYACVVPIPLSQHLSQAIVGFHCMAQWSFFSGWSSRSEQ